MRRKLYGNSIQPSCAVCAVGKTASDGKVVLCPHQGVTPLYHYCRKFVYDPIKRKPYRYPSLGKYSKEDFSID